MMGRFVHKGSIESPDGRYAPATYREQRGDAVAPDRFGRSLRRESSTQSGSASAFLTILLVLMISCARRRAEDSNHDDNDHQHRSILTSSPKATT